MGKLDQSKVEWIIREKRKGGRNKAIAETAGVSVRWVQYLWRRYGNESRVACPLPMGRPATGLPGRLEHSAILWAAGGERTGARILEDI